MKKEVVIVGTIFVLLVVSLSGCVQTNQTSDNKGKGKEPEQEYIWSEMTEGPYRDKVSFATSTDLLNWTDSGMILAEHASVPGAIYKDDTIYVYFVDVSEDGKPEQLGLIRSTNNGQNWSSKEYVIFDEIGDKVPVDPAPFLLDDGSIRLYYFDINEQRISPNTEATNKIYSAISTDGINFTQEEGVRFSLKDIYDPDVIKVNNTWRMYVGSGNKVTSAISYDGLNFTYEGIAYTGSSVPDAFFKDDMYYLYTAGIKISTSQNGASFPDAQHSFQPQQDKIAADPSVMELDDGTYMMLYKTKDRS